MARRRKTPEITIAENEDRSKAIVKAGKHYAMFPHALPEMTARERADQHAAMLEKSFRGKVAYRTSRAAPALSQWAKRRAEKATAVAYAKWLAKRDGIALPTAAGTPYFTTFLSAHEKTAKGRAVMLTRCRHVDFDKVRIEIPNWDFDPATPVETLEPELAMAA